MKFLLATTDPQKLPVTVLSRCLQFNLKRLDEDQISGQIRMILGEEGIAADDGAIVQIAKAADGSLRDGLSLLDQAIAYTGGNLDDSAVAAMLGTVDRARVAALLQALAAGDGEQLLAEVAQLAEFSPDWGAVLEALADALHKLQIKQLVPTMPVQAEGVDFDALAAQIRPELVQLWYQMALAGRRELPLAPSPRAGFEMSVLRMLAFRPVEGAATLQVSTHTPTRASSGTRGTAAEAARAALQETSHSVAPTSSRMPPRAAQNEAEASPPRTELASEISPRPAMALDAEKWLQLVNDTNLSGPVRQLALHSGFASHADGVLHLTLSSEDEHLKGPALVRMLSEALAPALGSAPQIRFRLQNTEQAAAETAHQRSERQRDARQQQAETAFINDPDVQRLLQRGAKIVPDSIRPLDE